MPAVKPSWILVEGGTADAVAKAAVEHSYIARPEVPTTHRGRVLALDGGRLAVTFDPPAPAYAFTNLIGWLDDPRMSGGATRACGWLLSPGTGVRYFLQPQRANAGGDTLVGGGSDGQSVSVFLPTCELSVTAAKVTPTPEPALPGGAPVAEFKVTLDSDPDFGNRMFVTE